MAVREPVRVIATGIVFAQPEDPSAAAHEWHEPFTPEMRTAVVDWRAGEALLLTHAVFVEFEDAGGETHRWVGTPQGPFPVSTRASATTELLARAEGWLGENLLADLGIAGYAVSRFDFHAAARRIDLADDLRRRLVLD